MLHESVVDVFKHRDLKRLDDYIANIALYSAFCEFLSHESNKKINKFLNMHNSHMGNGLIRHSAYREYGNMGALGLK